VSATTYVWRRLDLDGLVFVRLDEGAEGVAAAGYEICADGDERWAVRFSVELDPAWRHERTTVEVTDAAGMRRLELESDGAGSWLHGGRPDPSLEGCTDVDLAGNPFTNAFVTRRLAPGVGAELEVRAAFIEAPALSVRPLVQRYQRLAADRWLYADDEYGRFEFGADADGVAVDYEQLAERV
jgi:uncharacterized protein